MSGFDADWLSQREPFDRAARDPGLETAFVDALRANHHSHALLSDSPGDRSIEPRAMRLADLGGGTAANFRALAPRIDGDQHWVLFDHDPLLLAAAPGRIAHWARAQGWEAQIDVDPDATSGRSGGTSGRCAVRSARGCWTIDVMQIDLAASLESIDARRFDGIVTTAFLDLVSHPWLERLTRWLMQARRPLLATLTVDGLRRWSPVLDDDSLIEAAFRRHQGGDKGFGESVGPGAAAVLAECLRSAGCPVRLERSDWRIGPGEVSMLGRMAEEARAVALEVDPVSNERILGWYQQRRAQIDAGRASLATGHVDLLAIPGHSPLGLSSRV